MRQLKNVATGRCLAIPGGELRDGTQAAQQDCDSAKPEQNWRPAVNFVGSKTYTTVHNIATRKCLAIPGGRPADPTPVLRHTCPPAWLDQNWTLAG
ncbi:RICIN domain-containing protein [Allokutzneria albata]|uniref:Ricin-type beta-trefoil lectin domain-like n=1 Tax=Allokutzneria albata TaxID=211114 RepID=A0A1H0DEE2_ALLAB|nr:RICIN domain-containing protein [Allokutzneria albata]SDN68637.1 Ricin-type beta-trefoil lectin domain-like [Allokutzneria albata]